MSKTKLKLLIWSFLALVSLGLAFGLIGAISRLLASFQEGADPASALNIVPNVPPDLKVELTWLPDDADTGRQLEPYTRTQIESAYLRGWLQWNISYLKGEETGVATYFAGPALEAIRESITATHQQGWSMAQTDLEHHLKLHMYSADGSIVSFTAHDVLVAQIMRDASGKPIFTGVTRADYDVVMLLEDGNWRVRHWVRSSAELVEVAPPASPPGFVGVNGRQLMLNGEPFVMRGLNYYPQAAPWDLFWANYDPAVVAEDFALIQSLGLNTVRVFVPYEWPDPPQPEADLVPTPTPLPTPTAVPSNDPLAQPEETEEPAPAAAEPEPPTEEEIAQFMRQHLQDLLDRAQANNLKVIVTLFDFRTDYQILLWPNADRQLETLVPYFADHPAILAWDLKNEPDLDQPGNTQEMVNAWLRHTAAQVRRHDPNHLLTIGWAKIENANQLADLVDFVSFHYYGRAGDLPEKYADLQTAVANKPIALTEFGLPTWNPFWFPGGHTTQEQAIYYADIRAALAQTESSGYLAWTLYDFSHVPGSVVGIIPWRVAPQKHLGIVTANGDLKPAAFLLAEGAATAVAPLSPLARFAKPFWGTLLLAMGVMAAATVAVIRRFRPGFAAPVVDPVLGLVGRWWPSRLVRWLKTAVLAMIKRLWQGFRWLVAFPFRQLGRGLRWGWRFFSRIWRGVLGWLGQLKPIKILRQKVETLAEKTKRRLIDWIERHQEEQN